MAAEPERWQRVLEAALEARDGELFSDPVFDFGIEIMALPSFPDDHFEALVGIMRDRRFHGLNGAWNLIALFNYEWQRLSREQEERLLKLFEEIYASFTDWMSPFYIAETIGKRFPDGRGLDVFSRLARTRNHMARAFVPHGLEHLARSTREALVANRAVDQVLSMRGDASEQVSAEVDQVIERLVDRGVIGRA